MCSCGPRAPSLPPPPPPPMRLMWMTTESKRTVLDQSQGLRRDLTALVTSLADDNSRTQLHLDTLVSSMRENLHGVEKFLGSCIEPELYTEKRGEDSIMAQKTFEVPELLELVLDHLDIPDILSVYQLSKGMKETIEGSLKLHTKLGFHPASSDSHLQTPFENCLHRVGGFRCVKERERYHVCVEEPEEPATGIKAYFNPLPEQRLPKIGANYRRMRICQPNIREMIVSLRCCPHRIVVDSKPEIITSPDGLTIGDLYDCAEAKLKQHRLCPSGGVRIMDDDGFVKIGLTFRGTVKLCRDDPELIDIDRMEARRRQEQVDRRALRKQRDAYHHFKRHAHANELPIPTMQEFIATHPEYDTACSPNRCLH